MGRLELKNVKQMPDGRLYFRRKVNGKDTYHRLPDLTDPTFQAVYDSFAKPDSSSGNRQAAKPGTIAALIVAYRASSDFRSIPAASTRSNYLRYLDMLTTEDGHRTVAGVRPKHVYQLRDRYAETPGKANNWLTIFKVLMAFAGRIGMRDDNPASDVKPLEIGEHEPWPADLLQVCLEVATPMTRLLIVSGLCSGQRVSDVIRMQYGWISDGIMELKQKKRKAEVAFPMHPYWLGELAKLPRRSVSLVYDRSGKPFGTTGAIQSRLRDLMDMEPVKQVVADLVAREVIAEGTNFVFHGLRKNACCYLLEVGMNESEIGLMLGMSPDMVRHYGKRARALMVARSSIARVTGGAIIPLPRTAA